VSEAVKTSAVGPLACARGSVRNGKQWTSVAEPRLRGAFVDELFDDMGHLSPNLGFALAIAGILGIYCEFVWPGKVWPGSAGALILVSGAYSLSRYSPSKHGLALLGLAALLLSIESLRETRLVAGIAGTIALAAGSYTLFSGILRIAPVLGLPASAVFGGVTIWLANGARRARSNKRADLDS